MSLNDHRKSEVLRTLLTECQNLVSTFSVNGKKLCQKYISCPVSEGVMEILTPLCIPVHHYAL